MRTAVKDEVVTFYPIKKAIYIVNIYLKGVICFIGVKTDNEYAYPVLLLLVFSTNVWRNYGKFIM